VLVGFGGAATRVGQVRLESDGSPRRPLVHVEDISRAFLAVLEAPVLPVYSAESRAMTGATASTFPPRCQ
jgi:nucleoside-diphosphate-sugar epimerase